MTNTDAYLEIERRLNDAERKAFLSAVSRASPNLSGAYVADVLEIYDEHDAMLPAREAFAEAYGEEFKEAPKPLLRSACIVAAVMQPTNMLPLVRRLVQA